MDKVEEKFWEAVALMKELGVWQEPKQVGWQPGKNPNGKLQCTEDVDRV